MATKLTTVKRQSYTVSNKLRIIQFAEQHGNRAAEREFGVSKSNVRLWRKSKENLEKMPQLKRAFWSVASQTIWMDQKMNWFTIQLRTLMNLMIQASQTYLNQTLSQNLKVSLFRNVLFKDTEHFTWIERDTVVILKLPAVQWVEIPVKFLWIAVMLIIQVMNRDFKYWI